MVNANEFRCSGVPRSGLNRIVALCASFPVFVVSGTTPGLWWFATTALSQRCHTRCELGELTGDGPRQF